METSTPSPVTDAIRQAAHDLHASVNQHYDHTLPYAVHLDAVAAWTEKYMPHCLASEADAVAVRFAAFFHDSIEDARLTYNDVRRTAQQFMDGEQALLAAEIVYALTNEKGRTRQERASERYYEGIRRTPYAPLVKLADRLANMTHSFRQANNAQRHMCEVYAAEWPHFRAAITSPLANATAEGGGDRRFALPPEMLAEVERLFA